MSFVNNRLIRVLVADDDPEMRTAIVDFLELYGVQAVAAAGRQELTRHLAECSHDLVILDLQFGKENDLTLLPEIRSKSADLAIIGTGRGRDEIDRVIGLELGADDYLADPGDPAWTISPAGIAAARDRERALSFRRLAAGPPPAAADRSPGGRGGAVEG
jgi:DNA-binding response OmpR family regulator